MPLLLLRRCCGRDRSVGSLGVRVEESDGQSEINTEALALHTLPSFLSATLKFQE